MGKIAAGKISFEEALAEFEATLIDTNPDPFTVKRVVEEFANYLSNHTLTESQEREVREICRLASSSRFVDTTDWRGEDDRIFVRGLKLDELLVTLGLKPSALDRRGE